mmetsp:Transcript_21624/g.60910  ORF Transcript_21624/g.60910 Transcript_21624/m.60910 type:complete len:105 (-) Transcript_21624:144-458(-)
MARAGPRRAGRWPRPCRAHGLPPGAGAGLAATSGPGRCRAGGGLPRCARAVARCRSVVAHLRPGLRPKLFNPEESSMSKTAVPLFGLCLSAALLAYCVLVASGG